MNNIFQNNIKALNMQNKNFKIDDLKKFIIKKKMLKKILDYSNKLFLSTKNQYQIISILRQNYFTKINLFFNQSYIINWLQRLLYSDESLILFTNFPSIISILTLEITKNIQKNIIDLYKIILISSLPIIIYKIQNKFFLQTYKTSVNYIICEKNFSQKKIKKFNKKDDIKPSIDNIKNQKFLKKKDLTKNQFKEIFLILNLNEINKINRKTSSSIIKKEWNFINNIFDNFADFYTKNFLIKKNIYIKNSDITKSFNKYRTDLSSKINKFYIFLIKKNNQKFLNSKNISSDFINEEKKLEIHNTLKLLINNDFKILDSLNLIFFKYNLNFYHLKKYNIKKSGQNIVLDFVLNKKLWKYKVENSIHKNYQSLVKTDNKQDLFNKDINIQINKKIENIINPYWSFYTQHLFKTIKKHLSFIKNNIKTKTNYNIFLSKNYILKENQNGNFKTNFSTIKNNLNYPYKKVFLKNNDLKFDQIIETIHFVSDQNVTNPIFVKQKQNNTKVNQKLLVPTLKNLICVENKNNFIEKTKYSCLKTKWLKLNDIKDLNLNKNLNTSLTQDIRIIYSKVLKKNNNFFLENKNYLLNVKKIIIQKRYEKILTLHNDNERQYFYDKISNNQNGSQNLELENTRIIEQSPKVFIEPLTLNKYKENTKKNLHIKKKTPKIYFFKNKQIQKNLENNNDLSKITELNIFHKYLQWTFTSEWWFLLNKIIANKIPKIIENIISHRILNDYFIKLNIFSNLNFLQEKRQIKKFLSSQISTKLKTDKKVLLEETYKSAQKSNNISIWNTNYINGIRNLNQLVYISWFLTICIFYYHWLSILTGTPYLYIWYQFERMRSFSHPSFNTILQILVYNSIQSRSQQLKLNIYSSGGWIVWLKSKIFFYVIKQKLLSNLLFNTNCVDISRKKKNLVINYLISKNKLSKNYKLWNFKTNKKDNKNTLYSAKKKGLNYLQKWSLMYLRSFRLIGYKQKDSENLKWVNEIYFCGENSKLIDIEKIPQNLPEPILNKKRWLIVGTLETGKSILVKNIASSIYFPVIHISLKEIRHATPDEKYNKIQNSNKWIQQLSDRAFLLENALELAKMLSPCIFWISDLHEFHASSTINKKDNKIDDISFLFFMLLKMMTNDLLPSSENNITLITSTDSPSLLDPKFVSRHRLDFIINLRKYSFNQRQNYLLNILKNNNLVLYENRTFDELGSNTIGYSVRDLRGFANEILLIKTQISHKNISDNIIKLALYRQSSKQSTNNSILKNQIQEYKIGKSIIQSTLLDCKPIFPLTLRHDLWKNRFYYLHNVFLEKLINKPSVTELTIFLYIINHLSGSAARDALSFSNKKLKLQNISINKQLEHDSYIASNILQSLLLEFPIREIFDFHFNKNKLNRYVLLQKHNISITQKTIYSLNFFNRFASYTYWSYRIERLSLTCSLLFDNIKTSNKLINSQSFGQSIQERIGSKTKQERISIYGPYDKKRIREQNKYNDKIQNFFNKLILTNNLKTIDFPWISEYSLNYNALEFSIILLDTKALWNPPVLKPYYSLLFFNRDLLINRDILTKFYITYGEKFQSQKLNPKRIKEELTWTKTRPEKSGLPDNSLNKEEIKEFKLEDFNSFRQIAKNHTYFQSSQIEGRFYLYQSWNDPDYEEKFRSSDLLTDRKYIKNDFLQDRELLIYGTLIEIYYRLFEFFVKNKSIFKNIKQKLLEEYVIDRKYIENLVQTTKFL